MKKLIFGTSIIIAIIILNLNVHLQNDNSNNNFFMLSGLSTVSAESGCGVCLYQPGSICVYGPYILADHIYIITDC